MPEELPAEVIETAANLARASRAAGTPERITALEEQREALLDQYGYTSRIREDDDGVTLVCYPDDWVSDGTVDVAGIEDTDAAVELRIAGAGDPDDWQDVADRNRRVAEQVADEHGPVHGANARAFAEFMNNHRAREVATATEEYRTEFREEYFVRNVWPSEAQEAAIEESLELLLQIATATEN